MLSESELEDFNIVAQEDESDLCKLTFEDEGEDLTSRLLYAEIITSDQAAKINYFEEDMGLDSEAEALIVLSHIWTVIEADDSENMYAAAGFHTVNREGLLVTEKPWADKESMAMFFDASEMMDDDEPSSLPKP